MEANAYLVLVIQCSTRWSSNEYLWSVQAKAILNMVFNSKILSLKCMQRCNAIGTIHLQNDISMFKKIL